MGIREKSKLVRIPVSLVEDVESLVRRHRQARRAGPAFEGEDALPVAPAAPPRESWLSRWFWGALSRG